MPFKYNPFYGRFDIAGTGGSGGGSGDNLTWNTISTSQPLIVGNGYICISPGGALVLPLPATAILGDMIEIILNGSTSFQVTQVAGQNIIIGKTATTPTSGSLTSTSQGDWIKLICQSSLIWIACVEEGNITVI